jgi:hypothetical protein
MDGCLSRRRQMAIADVSDIMIGASQQPSRTEVSV